MSESQPIDENEFARRLEQVEDAARVDQPVNVDDEIGDHQEQLQAAAEVVNLIHRVRRGENSASRDTANRQLDTPADSADEEFLSTAPKKIGRFQIKRQLGHGGYGLVFLAHDPHLERDVAVKVPRLETFMNEDMASRFEREAKAAASLSHPNIVPVFDSGSVGRICYIAYQFVDGISLAEWLKQLPGNELPSADDSARLVETLADAVHHAHQRGVLHRDLKPANVMLTETDQALQQSVVEPDKQQLSSLSSCRPMITDFGLAKIVSSHELVGQVQGQTRTGSIIGTPAYMAPENVKSQRELIGPSSDVYSLGVLLYELLTRKNPFVRDSLIGTMEAVQQFDPLPPSRLSRSVARDLDAIVLKCLEKDVAKRYETASDLRADLERYLNREPVHARKITLMTRTSRWISRNRIVAALLVMLAAGMAGTTFGLFRAQNAENEARRAEKVAVVEAETAVKVSDFLEDIFDVPDLLGGKPGQQRGKEITAEDILKHGAIKIQNELDDQPEVKARLLTKIGSILVKLGSYEEGERLLRDGLDLRQQVFDSEHPELAASHRQLAKILLLRERTKEAENQLRVAIKILESDEQANRHELSAAYNDLGLMLKTRDLSGARSAYKRALQLRAGDQSKSLWRLEANIAAIDARLADYENARDGFEKAMESASQSYGTDDHPAVATIMNNLAFVHRKLGNYHRARTLQERNLAISEQQLGQDHPQVGSALIGLIAICKRLGDYQAASEYGVRAIEVNSKSLPPEHRNITIAMTHHAETLMHMGDYDEARKQMQDAKSQTELRQDSEAEVQQVRHLLLLSTIERKSSRLDAALDLINEASSHPMLGHDRNVAMNMRFARALLMAQMKNEDAQSIYSEALEFAQALPGLSAADRAYFQARFWALVGDQEKALQFLDQAVDSGFRDALMLTDPDLSGIKSDPRFAELAQAVQQVLQGGVQ